MGEDFLCTACQEDKRKNPNLATNPAKSGPGLSLAS